MTDKTDVATDGGESTDSFDEEFAAFEEQARAAESTDPANSTPAASDPPAEETTTEASTDAGAAGGEAGQEAAKPPLSIEEANKRWQDAKGMAHAERAKARDQQRENQALHEQIAELRGLITNGAQPQEQVSQGLDSDDPMQVLGALRDVARDLQQERADQQRTDQQTEQEQQYRTQIETGFVQAENEIREHLPDYGDAVNFLMQSHAGELRAFGMTGEQLEAEMGRRVFGMAEYAMGQTETHPGAMMYKLAQARGYTPNAAPANGAGDARQKPVEKQIDPAAAAAAVKDVEARAAAEQVTQTMSGTGGGSTGSDEITIETVNEATGDEFDKLFEKFAKQQA
ncbi:MAG: hypothetical protein AAGA08_16910 [Pseudomonadota bacterium]